ncbi:hypothetical protein ACHQM5_002564 [Ranunculus cassubicifolius]
MALGRIIKTEGSRSLSAPVVVGFVALCLVGVWMLMASSTVPVQDFSREGQPTEQQSTTTKDNQQFVNSPHNASEDDIKVDTNTDTPQGGVNPDEQKNDKLSEKSKDTTNQELHEENSEEKGDGRNDTDISKPEAQNDAEKGKGESPDQDLSLDSEKKRLEGATSTSGQVESDGSSSERNQTEANMDGNQNKYSEGSNANTTYDQPKDQVSNKVFSDGLPSEILNETSTQNGAWSTQAVESKNENEERQSSEIKNSGANGYSWKVCNVTAGPDYIPCLDNLEAIRNLRRNLRTTKHYEHRERHCPEEGPTCLVPLPKGYRQSIEWPQSREKIWYYNVPHTKLVEVKGHQNWVKVSGENLIFPGAWGKHTRVVLDVGCGVANFGGFLFDKDVLTMSFAPKDEHVAQVQFALERGIPAILSVMGTTRLPFPGRVFDAVHCARCRVPWHIEGGKLLLELNRVLRPGGYFVWSATPLYPKTEEDAGIWKEMSALLKKMCWEVVVNNKDKVNKVGVEIFRKPSSNECYEKRRENSPPICQEYDDPNAAWNVQLQACMHKVPKDVSDRGSHWPEQWPERMVKPPYWLKSTQVGHWKHFVSNSYLNGMGISWKSVRNVMDMRSVYGGFAAALKDLKLWTLPIIYERGLFGIYHDWCESFNTYPRSYDLLHADHLFSKLKTRCKLTPVIAEVDRILRPGGKLIVRDNSETITELENMAKSLHWEIRMISTKGNEGLLCAVKTMWRPNEVETIISAIA